MESKEKVKGLPVLTPFSQELIATMDQQALIIESQRQIEELQSQVKLLSAKATAAVDRWADYEDQIQALHAQIEQQNMAESRQIRTPSIFSGYGISSFLGRRNSAQNQPIAPLTPPPTSTSSRPPSTATIELETELSRERKLRETAQKKLNEVSSQIEDLSVHLFTQANEMVATERRERAKLESRVKILEKRDVEKKQRLERLEDALKRIERVRNLLAPT
ncbi:hypothetical protein K3495_g2429 [Podosphaera aphanis]|nr:hypothetical protein K3495_g2429 [Podosphaera aphanis]